MKFFLFLFSLLGLVVGFSIILGDNVNLMQFCSKDCGIIRAIIEIFGRNVANFIVGALWVAGGLFFLSIGLRKDKDE